MTGKEFLSDVRAWRVSWGTEELAMISIPSALESRLEKMLTPAEKSIVLDVAAGKSNARIASLRGTSPRTVANQLASIYRKLNLTSRQELLAEMNLSSAVGKSAGGRCLLPERNSRVGR